MKGLPSRKHKFNILFEQLTVIRMNIIFPNFICLKHIFRWKAKIFDRLQRPSGYSCFHITKIDIAFSKSQRKCIKNPTIQPRSIKCRLILRVLADWIFSIYIVTNFKFIHPVICLCEQLADRHDRFFIRSCTSKAEIAWIFNLFFHFFLKFQMSLFQPLPQRICRICFT